MYLPPQSLLGRLLHRFTVRRWRGVERGAADITLPALERQRQLALRLIRPLRRFLHVADTRLAPGARAPFPSGTDWHWQPRVFHSQQSEPGVVPAPNGTTLTPEIGLYHDCPSGAVTLRQHRNCGQVQQAPFGITVETYQFAGSFLSLVIEVPPVACQGLRRRHILRLDLNYSAERPTTLNARLNLRNGPNVEQIMRQVPLGQAEVAFDLAYTQLNEKRAEKIWIDLMISDPAMNRITLHDVTLARYPRAEVG